MAQIALRGLTANTIGELPAVGSDAPDFTLIRTDLSEASLSDYSGKRLILNIFPSIDTPTCAQSVRRFNKEASETDNTIVVCVSADLPFANQRFCGAEGIQNVETNSTFRDSSFPTDYGVLMIDGPLKELLARAIVVIDERGKISHTQLVADISTEPDYDAALASR